MAKRTDTLDLSSLALDWKLAGQRLAKDIRDDFWPDPLGFQDVIGLTSGGPSRLDAILADYKPRRGTSYHVPKANLTIRDSIHVSPVDRLVYQALIDGIIEHIDPKLLPTVFSHRLRGPAAKWIFKSPVAQWKSFLDAVAGELANRPGSFLVITDVAQYFETVKFRPLKLQFEKILGSGIPDILRRRIDALMSCLSAWCPYDGYGLIQNVDASSFLGNVLLDHVDQMMDRDGYPIFRYMDDIRIVVSTEADARRSLVKLVSHLRAIGLGLNSAKTAVITPDSPELLEHLEHEDVDVSAIEAAIGTKDRDAVQGIVERLFSRTIQMLDKRMTGERVFRFCLNRIASLRSYRNLDLPAAPEITSAVLRLLVPRPVETDTFCRYLESAPLLAEHHASIERLLTSEPLCVYAWQNFRLWRVAALRGTRSSQLRRRAHALVSGDRGSPEAAAAALYLGGCGDYADRQAVRNAMSAAPAGMVRRCMQIAIQELHKAERTPAYQELALEDLQAESLAEHLKSLSEPIYMDNPPQVGVEEFATEDRQAKSLAEHLESLVEPVYVDEPPQIGIEDLSDAMPSVYA